MSKFRLRRCGFNGFDGFFDILDSPNVEIVWEFTPPALFVEHDYQFPELRNGFASGGAIARKLFHDFARSDLATVSSLG